METKYKSEVNTVNNKLGRNDPCHCGSGRKYKKCCLSAEQRKERIMEQEKKNMPTQQQAMTFLSGVAKQRATVHNATVQVLCNAQMALEVLPNSPEKSELLLYVKRRLGEYIGSGTSDDTKATIMLVKLMEMHKDLIPKQEPKLAETTDVAPATTPGGNGEQTGGGQNAPSPEQDKAEAGNNDNDNDNDDDDDDLDLDDMLDDDEVPAAKSDEDGGVIDSKIAASLDADAKV